MDVVMIFALVICVVSVIAALVVALTSKGNRLARVKPYGVMFSVSLAVLIITPKVMHESAKEKPQVLESKIQVVQSSDPALQKIYNAYFPAVKSICPGLEKYAGDIGKLTVDKTYLSGYEDGAEVAFTVSENPTQLPPPLNIRSRGHKCGIVIAKDGSRVFIGKSACHSICDGVLHENDPDSLGREFKL